MARKEKEPFPENEEEDEVIAVAAFVVTTASDGGGMSVRPHFGIEQPVALVFSYKANVTDSNET